MLRPFILTLFISFIVALYGPDDTVVQLTSKDLEEGLGDEVWVVEFYAPWCGHCKKLVPEYKKAADVLKGVVKVGAVDCDEHKNVSKMFGVTGFPTIKIFSGKESTVYKGERTAKAIAAAALEKAHEKVTKGLALEEVEL